MSATNIFVPTPGVPVTLLNAVAATGVSSLALSPIKSVSGSPTTISWQTFTTGSPTGVTVVLQGTLDWVTWAAIDTSTSTTGELRFASDSPVVGLRLNLSVLSGGTVPTVTGIVMVSNI